MYNFCKQQGLLRLISAGPVLRRKSAWFPPCDDSAMELTESGLTDVSPSPRPNKARRPAPPRTQGETPACFARSGCSCTCKVIKHSFEDLAGRVSSIVVGQQALQHPLEKEGGHCCCCCCLAVAPHQEKYGLSRLFLLPLIPAVHSLQTLPAAAA